jgi:hypothetical protein
LDALVTCCDHRVTGRQAFENFHFARLAQADLDRHPLGHADIGLVTVHHLDHEGATALRDDGLFGNDQGVFTGAKHRIDSGKHARAQLLLAVINTAAHTHRAAIGFDQWIDRLHNGGEGATGQGVHRQLGFLSGTHPCLKTLGQAEVEEHGIHVLDVDHVSTVLEVIAHVDLFETRDAIEWRQYL